MDREDTLDRTRAKNKGTRTYALNSYDIRTRRITRSCVRLRINCICISSTRYLRLVSDGSRYSQLVSLDLVIYDSSRG